MVAVHRVAEGWSFEMEEPAGGIEATRSGWAAWPAVDMTAEEDLAIDDSESADTLETDTLAASAVVGRRLVQETAVVVVAVDNCELMADIDLADDVAEVGTSRIAADSPDGTARAALGRS
jgi:hypothetical protein